MGQRLRAVVMVLVALVLLLVGAREASASSGGIGNSWGFNSATGCMSCHSNVGNVTPSPTEVTFGPTTTVGNSSVTKLTITVDVSTGWGAGVNITAFSPTGAAPAGAISACAVVTAGDACDLQVIGTSLTHKARHQKNASNQVQFSFNYTAPAAGCFIDKLEIWVNNINDNLANTGDQAKRFDHYMNDGGSTCRASAGVCDVAEACVLNLAAFTNTCPADSFQPNTTVCRGSAGVCDKAENCTGTSAACPADTFLPNTTVCRGSAGVCDQAENCTGTGAACPADTFLPNTTVCRGSAGVCDQAENCTGASAACPADTFLPNTTVCRGSAGVCDQAENCTGASAACPADTFLPNTTVCRASAGVCDKAENCTGASAACPADAFLPNTSVCRAAAGVCDQAENCTGASAACPADTFLPNTTVCRASAGVCDQAENCTGASAACPADTFLPNTTVCRPSAGVCDKAENCSGAAAACPADTFLPNTTVCRAAAGVCDQAETCTGASAACPADTFLPNTSVCRASAGPCDQAENCTGASSACPADTFLPSTSVCRPAAGPCDQAESCTGSGAACPADTFLPATTVCRPSAGPCDVAESCSGAAAACPADTFRPATTVCRPAAGVCDVAESCTGAAAACPADGKTPAGTVCRPSAGPCDPNAEACDGVGNACPADVLAPSGTVCSPASCSSGSETLAAVCSGSTASCPAAGNQSCGGFVCGATACLTTCATPADCGAGFTCDGTSTCVPKFDLGTTCNGSIDCKSGFCVDGVCCDTGCSGQCEACNQGALGSGLGTCSPKTGAPAGSRAACADDGTGCGGSCDGVVAIACSYPGATTSCRGASCAASVSTLAAACDGAGACPPVQTQSCGSFTCSGTECAGDCAANGDADCVTGKFCAGGVCIDKQVLGLTCGADDQCASGNCVDGVCCDTACTGQCEACALPASRGTCSPVTGAPAAGRAPCAADGTSCGGTCDGTDTALCAYPGSSVECRPASCTNDVATVQASCTGVGSCPALVTVDCAPFVCDGTGTSCAGNCTIDTDCAASSFCRAGVCQPKSTNGQSCGGDDACASGHCVDGVCCNSACTEQCGACDVAGNVGTCSPIVGAPNGNKAQCATDGSSCGGTCDGTSIAACSYPDNTVVCRNPSCTANTATLQATCDGQGACPPVTMQTCGASGCGANLCIGDCLEDTDCGSNEFCSAGVCKPTLGNGTPCTDDGQCNSGVCVDGVCCNKACDGQCEACDVKGKEGSCTAVDGKPHTGRAACGGSGACGGSCDGKKTDACAFPGSDVSCGDASCDKGVANGAPTCKGDGTCGSPKQTKCASNACSGDVCSAEPCSDGTSAQCGQTGSCACEVGSNADADLGALALAALGIALGMRRRRAPPRVRSM